MEQSLHDRVVMPLKAAGSHRRRADRTSKPFRSKPKIGRPTKFLPEYCQLVVERMGQGFSLTAFAGSIGVATDTVYGWKATHSAFSEAVSRARAAQVLWLEQKLMRSMRSQDGVETKATLFALRNACPQEWGNVKYQEHQHLHQIRQLTNAQLNAIAAGHTEPA
jgi:hypothetical protein